MQIRKIPVGIKMKTLSIQDFEGDKDAYYNFKRAYRESVRNLRQASIYAGFFCPAEVQDVLNSEGMSFEFED